MMTTDDTVPADDFDHDAENMNYICAMAPELPWSGVNSADAKMAYPFNTNVMPTMALSNDR